MKFTIYQESRQGGRTNNEDRIAYCYTRDALLMVVADGMGGHYYGEIASQIAAQTLTESFHGSARPRLDDPFAFLQRSFDSAHRAIRDYAYDHRLDDSPRTTCVACIVQDNIAYWAHTGDSRLYLLRGGRLKAATRDHSQVRAMADQGLITEAQMATHPDRNKIYSCLGGDQPPEIELSRKTTLEAGDVLLLSTDGFWGPLPVERLALRLRDEEPMRCVPELMNEAERLGGPHCDNLSVVVVRWLDNYFDAGPSTVSTKTMGLDEVNTRIDEFGRQPGHKLDLSDEEIEKAIDEIRLAIEKYSIRKP